MKKLVTVLFSRTVLVEVPDGATVDSLTEISGPHSEAGDRIIADAADEVEASSGEITDIQDEE